MKKQAHKTRRQLQAEKLLAARNVISKANNAEDTLALLDKYHYYELPDGNKVEFTCSRVTFLSDECRSWIIDLMERNMKTMYEKSSWGWNKEKKENELTEDSAWYLIAKSNGSNIGFSHFRFDLDDGIAVLYCYELQLEENVRRKGIGKFMMKILDSIAVQYQVEKVVLTVFKQNEAATQFYDKLRFKTDITNPPTSQKMDYVILSKRCF